MSNSVGFVVYGWNLKSFRSDLPKPKQDMSDKDPGFKTAYASTWEGEPRVFGVCLKAIYSFNDLHLPNGRLVVDPAGYLPEAVRKAADEFLDDLDESDIDTTRLSEIRAVMLEAPGLFLTWGSN